MTKAALPFFIKMQPRRRSLSYRLNIPLHLMAEILHEAEIGIFNTTKSGKDISHRGFTMFNLLMASSAWGDIS